jgi:ornithine--oxo-acid transaminase
MKTQEFIDLTEKFSAHNYAPLPVVLSSAEGAWVTDVEGRRYLDLLSAYSALNFGHRNARITAAAVRQLDALTLTSRAVYSENFALFCQELATLCKKDKVLPMNSGAEAVETAIKATRKWGYEVKGIPSDKAEIIVCKDNFHGRTIAIVGFSTSEESRKGFGPFTGGFKVVEHGSIEAVKNAITPHTAGVLFEPILGEGGYIIPPEGFLKDLRAVCSEHNVLMIADEIQTGLCRTGEIFACDHEGVIPDIFVLGKSLGGGIMPLSAIAADDAVMNVFTPGSHGSTFGGNPLASAIGREVIALIREEEPHKKAAELGSYIIERISAMNVTAVTAVRARGLMVGIDVDMKRGKAKDFCKALLNEGVICKDTRVQSIRVAPPLCVSKDDLDWALERFERVLA